MYLCIGKIIFCILDSSLKFCDLRRCKVLSGGTILQHSTVWLTLVW